MGSEDAGLLLFSQQQSICLERHDGELYPQVRSLRASDHPSTIRGIVPTETFAVVGHAQATRQPECFDDVSQLKVCDNTKQWRWQWWNVLR